MVHLTQHAAVSTASASVPPATPAWITGDLIETTIRVWQPFYNEPITTEVAVDMLIRVGKLFGTLCPKVAFSSSKET